MTLRWYLIIMTVATIFCWSAFIYVIMTINPEITNWLGFALFYLALFMAAVGSISIIGFLIRFIGLKHELVSQSVIAAFRQSILFAVFIVTVLFLLSRNLFSWLNLIFLIIGLSILEFFLLSYGRTDTTANNSNNVDKNNVGY